MVADFFEMDGWDVIYLGADAPSVDIVGSVGERVAKLLAVSVSTLLHLCTVGRLIEQVRQDERCAKTNALAGGPPFKSVPDLWSESGADGSAVSAAAAVKLGNALAGEGS
jgi:methanogenic corrinoid protein MtbC1